MTTYYYCGRHPTRGRRFATVEGLFEADWETGKPVPLCIIPGLHYPCDTPESFIDAVYHALYNEANCNEVIGWKPNDIVVVPAHSRFDSFIVGDYHAGLHAKGYDPGDMYYLKRYEVPETRFVVRNVGVSLVEGGC